MILEKLVTLFISYQQAVHVIRGDGLEAVSLQLAPAAWFVSIKSSGRLNIGIYEGDELRLVGTRTIPLAELEPNFLRREIEEALGKQILALLDPGAVSVFLKRLMAESDFNAVHLSRDPALYRCDSESNAEPREVIPILKRRSAQNSHPISAAQHLLAR